MKALLTFALSLFLLTGYSQTLSVSPNLVTRGQSGLSILFSGSGFSFTQGTNTSGVYFVQASSTVIYPSYINSASSSLMNAIYDIPTYAACGSYDAVVFGQGSSTLTFPNALTVNCPANVNAQIYSMGAAAICDGQATTLAVSQCSNCTYVWSNGANTRTITTATPGSYSVTVSDGSNTASGGPYLLINDAMRAAFTLVRDTTAASHWFAVNTTVAPYGAEYGWYWGDGSGADYGATASHTFSSPGFYGIELFALDSMGCTSYYLDSSTYLSRTQSIVSVQAIMANVYNGIDQIDQSAWSIYPNPVASVLNIRNDNARISEVTLYDMVGNAVINQTVSGHSTTLQTEALPAGIYLVRIKTDRGDVTRRVSIMH